MDRMWVVGIGEQTSSAGMDGFLGKPISMADLREAVRAWCGLSA
jgi:hypothetical protein